MVTTLQNLLTDSAELLRPYSLPSSVKEEDGVRIFSSMNIKWNNALSLGFSSPLPDEDRLNTFYSTTYRRLMNKRRGFDHYVSSPNYRAQTRSQVAWVKAVMPSEGEWLDVGAGFGLLLWTVRQQMPGWSLNAIEPDEEAVNELQKFAKVESNFPDLWKRLIFAPNAFDVVSLSHVLEHLIDPITSLNTLFHYLKPGGYLLIEVPNDSRDELLRPTRISDMPHLWFFSSTGLSCLIEKAGFRVERIATLGLKRPGVKDNVFVRTRRAAMRQIHGSLALLDDPTWYAKGSDRCDLRVLARKPLISEAIETATRL